MSRVLAWVAALVGVPALQVLLGLWAFRAYQHHCNSAHPGAQPGCGVGNGVNLLLPPVWSLIVLWFLVDLAILLLGLRVLQRHDAGRGAPWRQGALRRRTSILGAALAVHMLLGYWWVMAYTQGPDSATPGECPACFWRAVREQTVLGSVDPGLVFLIWAGVDLVLLWFGVWLIRSRPEAPERPALVEVF